MKNKLSATSDIQYATFDRRMIASSIDIMIVTIILYPIMGLVHFLLYRGSRSLDDFFTEYGNTVNAEDLSHFIFQEAILLKWFCIQLVVLIVMATYFLWFWQHKGATPGKLLAKCQIVDVNTNKIPSLKRCIGRFFGYLLSTLPIMITTLFILYANTTQRFRSWYIIFIPLSCFGFFIQTITKKRQALHDFISGTAVIKLTTNRKKKFFIF
jgi:uncharacterized RDD family membrane protein YckC